jgi:hypothetical protein
VSCALDGAQSASSNSSEAVVRDQAELFTGVLDDGDAVTDLREACGQGLGLFVRGRELDVEMRQRVPKRVDPDVALPKRVLQDGDRVGAPWRASLEDPVCRRERRGQADRHQHEAHGIEHYDRPEADLSVHAYQSMGSRVMVRW